MDYRENDGRNSAKPIPDLQVRNQDRKRGWREENTSENVRPKWTISKRRKESEKQDNKMHFTATHSLAPHTISSFQRASTGLYSHLSRCGASPQQAFITALSYLRANGPTKVTDHDLVSACVSLPNLPAHTLAAAFIIRNELIGLKESGYSLGEAVNVLSKRLEFLSRIPPSDLILASEFPDFQGVHIDPDSPLKAFRSQASLQSTTRLPKSPAIDSSSVGLPSPPTGPHASSPGSSCIIGPEYGDDRDTSAESTPNGGETNDSSNSSQSSSQSDDHLQEEYYGSDSYHSYESSQSVSSQEEAEETNENYSPASPSYPFPSPPVNSRKRSNLELAPHPSDLLPAMASTGTRSKKPFLDELNPSSDLEVDPITLSPS